MLGNDSIKSLDVVHTFKIEYEKSEIGTPNFTYTKKNQKKRNKMNITIVQYKMHT